MSIYTKLFNFQKTIRIVDKDSSGYGYKYASLDNIIRTIQPALEEQGLAYFHSFNEDKIICTLVDSESGETVSSTLTLPALEAKGMNASQVQGASITYARRYTLTALLGLVTDEDTDANVNQKAPKEAKAELVNTANPTDTIWMSKEQFDTLVAMIKNNENIDGVKATIKKYSGYTDENGTKHLMKKDYKEQLNQLINLK